jgi:phosphoglycerate dehydrogenase-like enzyme
LPERLRTLTNVILSPHQGAFTEEAKADMLEMALANLRAHFAGQALISPVP